MGFSRPIRPSHPPIRLLPLALLLACANANALEPDARARLRAGAQACGTLFERQVEAVHAIWQRVDEVVHRLVLRNRIEHFDFRIYDESLARFSADPSAKPQFSLLEEEAAFWEAELARLKVGPGIGDLLRNGDARTRYGVLRAFEGSGYSPWKLMVDLFQKKTWRSEVDSAAGMKRSRVLALLEDLFVLRKTRIQPQTWELVMPTARKRVKDAFRARMEYEIASQGLLKHLTELGIVAPAAKAKVFKIVKSPAFQIALSLGTHLQIASGVLGYLPHFELFKLPPETLEKITRDGLDPHWPEVEKAFLPQYRKQVYYDAFRTAYTYVALTVGSIYAYQSYRHQIESAEERAKDEADELIRELDRQNRELEEEIRRLERLGQRPDSTSH